MKKITMLVALVLLLLSPLSAKSPLDFSFQWFNSQSLYHQNPTDNLSGLSTLEVILLQTGQPRTVRVMPNAAEGYYEDLATYPTGTYADEKLYLRLKTGANIGLLRVSLFEKNAQLELAFTGALNSLFQGFGGADSLGFDGMFFFGPQLRLFDRISFKFGLQHYSGHYGDETLNNFLKVNGEIRRAIAYTRDNNIFFGLEVEPIRNLHFHAEATLPRLKTWIEPAVHIPAWVLKPSDGEIFYIKAANGENIVATAYPDSYKAWMVQTGLSYDLPFTKQLGISLSGDLKLHQDGMTKHQAGGYSDDNPWEVEYTIGGGLTLTDPKSSYVTRINFTYHNGRLPLFNYFYQRTSYIAISVMIG